MIWVSLTYLLLSTLTPGPVTIMTIRTTALYGRRAGLAVALGGAATAALFVAVSLTMTRFDVVGQPLHAGNYYQQGGALFFLMLGLISGYKVLASRQVSHSTGAKPDRLLASFFTGMGLMAPYLPQAVLFYTVILPQHTLTGELASDILLVGTLKIGLTIGWYSLLAQAAQSIQTWFFHQHTQRVVESVAACLLLVISITMLIQ